jgi:hypothetical protein
MILLVSRLHNVSGRRRDKSWIGKDLEETWRDLTELLSRHLPGEAEDSQVKP